MNASAKNPSGSKSRARTPMLTQYLDLKAQHPEALLLFRMGDFYETFFEDAELLASITGVTLTSRDAKSKNPVPLAGVPYHAIDTYLSKLLGAGLTVAICEQVEDPAQAKGLVKREIVEIISPGTAVDPKFLNSSSGQYCLAWEPGSGHEAGWALLDASTGDFRCGQESALLADVVERYSVREVIVREGTAPEQLKSWGLNLPHIVFNQVNNAWFHPEFARRSLLDHFRVANLSPFGLESADDQRAVTAAGAVLRYLTTMTMKRPDQVQGLKFSPRDQGLILDEETLTNLEVMRTFRGDKGPGTLIHHLDGTLTPMGRRLLEMRLARPTNDLAELEVWHEGQAGILTGYSAFEPIRSALRGLGDLERKGASVASLKIGPASLYQLGKALNSLMSLRHLAQKALGFPDIPDKHIILRWLGELPDLGKLAADILRIVAQDAPAGIRKPGFIQAGVDRDLDQAREVSNNSKDFLARLQAQEREATGIPTLKIGFNKVFGYYFEITNKNLDRVPAHYQQKQTLVGSCRYHTPQLKESENSILAAEDIINSREKEIFQELVQRAHREVGDILAAARLIGNIDLLLGFAAIARKHQYCRPVMDNSLELDLRQARHPVIEQILDQDFIPNDTFLDGEQNQILLLTGPNMGGKSTYLRQVALIILMAQAGSFVPAASARIGIVDRIFTRVGASDNLSRGESTFYMEMSETARILHSMTRRSLVILDEVGRGTSTYDGLSLAWAITEFLGYPDGPRPRSIFATHYHELTDLEGDLTGLVNFCLDVKEWQGKIIFMHTVRPGRSDKSYGIHVARLAGLPEPVLDRAEQILASLSGADARDFSSRLPVRAPGQDPPPKSDSPQAQLSLFREGERDALAALRQMNLETLSPLDAFVMLAKIRQQLDD